MESAGFVTITPQHFNDNTFDVSNVKNTIINIICASDLNFFMFSNFITYQRHVLYITLTELSLNFTKMVSDNDSSDVHIKVYISPSIRSRFTRLNKPTVVPLTHNLQQKILLSDLIFDVKDKLSDNMFKDIMEALQQIDN